MRRLLLLFPLLFLLELVLGESGRWLRVGGLSVRQVLFVLTVLSLYAYAAATVRKRPEITRIDVAVFFFIVVSSVWGFLVPALYDRSLSLAFADFEATYVLLLYFPLAVALRAGALSWRGTSAVFAGAVVLLAAVQVAAWALVTLRLVTAAGARGFFLGLYNTSEVYVGPMPDGFFRSMFVTSIFLLPVFFVLASAVVEKARPFVPAGLLFVVSCGLVVSYTRAFWASAAIGLVLAWMLYYFAGRPHGWAWQPRAAGKVVLPALVFVGAFAAVETLTAVAATDTTSLDDRVVSSLEVQDEANAIKLEQIPYLLAEWWEAPIFGRGFGSYVEGYTRSAESPFSYEMTAPALLMKLGVVGGVLWAAPLIYALVRGLRSAGKESRARACFATAGFLAFGLSVQTNPLLLNFVGMAILLFYFLEFAMLECGARRAVG